MRFTFY